MLKPCRSTSHASKIIPQAAAIPGFQRDGDKEAKLTNCSFKFTLLKTDTINSAWLTRLFFSTSLRLRWISTFFPLCNIAKTERYVWATNGECRIANIFLMMCYFSRRASDTSQLTPDNTAHPGEDTLCLLGANWPSRALQCRTAFPHSTV